MEEKQQKKAFSVSFYDKETGGVNKSFINSLKDTVTDSIPVQVATGIMNKLMADPVIEHLHEERISICKACDVYTTAGICSRKKGGCGCDLGIKTRAPKQFCPFNKWVSVDLTEYSNEYYKGKV